MDGVHAAESSRKRASTPASSHPAKKLALRGRALATAAAWRALALSEASLPLHDATEVWLVGLGSLPSLNGEHCRVRGFDDATGFLRVRRLCVAETLLVSWQNLAESAPDDITACARVLSLALGDDVTARILKFATCERCWRSCEIGSVCRVEHPPSQRASLSSLERCGEEFHLCRCGACHSKYDYAVERKECVLVGGEIIPDYCFTGTHTLSPLRDGDFRRSFTSFVSISEHGNPNFQAELDVLPAHLESLSLRSKTVEEETFDLMRPSGMYPVSDYAPSYPKDMYRLDGPLPNLKRFSVSLAGVITAFGPGSTPELEQLFIREGVLPRNISSLRKLRRIMLVDTLSVHMSDNMLDAANLLEVVVIARVHQVRKLSFVSPVLRKVYLSDLPHIEAISIWAPYLDSLVLPWEFHRPDSPQWSFSFVFENKLSSTLPGEYTPPILTIETPDFDEFLHPAVASELQRHPNWRWGELDRPSADQSDWEVDNSSLMKSRMPGKEIGF